MEREEKVQFELWVKGTEKSSEIFDDVRYADVLNMIKESSKVPVILTDTTGTKIQAYLRLDSTKTNYINAESTATYDPAYFQRELRRMKEQHTPLPINYMGEKMLVYYKDSFILTQLRYFPYIQLGVIALFLITAYVAFSAARKAEQDQVWVGMAKETAHQLGTPISSLMAWVELMKSRFNAENDPLIEEMENDIKRLEVITDRFSKIGSKPILEDHVVYVVINNFVNYFKLRTSDKINFLITGDDQVRALLNVPLFDWVIENLLKNAANAISNEGTITVNIIEHLAKEEVFIDVTDTGRGIPRSKFEAVFQPGYTTRKRGWGLGLSLTKRIVQNYHSGQIFVKESELGKGTTFRIVLKSSITYEPTTT
jgi:signal transduction histidine kinase